jgi:hypothetical protein
MIETPKVVETAAQLVAAIHIETPRSKMQQVMGPGISEVMTDLSRSLRRTGRRVA